MSAHRLAFACVALAGADLSSWREQLSPAEQTAASGQRFERRRIEYVGGRLASRRALAELDFVPSTLEILAVSDGPSAGAPEVRDRRGRPLPVEVTISHGGGFACAAAAIGAEIGLDLEVVAPRDLAFEQDTFAEGTIDQVSRWLGEEPSRDQAITVAWCLKEACMKLEKTGMRSRLGSFAPTRLRWEGPRPSTDDLELASMRPAVITTHQTGPLAARVLCRSDLAAVLVMRPDSRGMGMTDPTQ